MGIKEASAIDDILEVSPDDLDYIEMTDGDLARVTIMADRTRTYEQNKGAGWPESVTTTGAMIAATMRGDVSGTIGSFVSGVLGVGWAFISMYVKTSESWPEIIDRAAVELEERRDSGYTPVVDLDLLARNYDGDLGNDVENL